MNARTGMALLAVACVGLIVALMAIKRQADARQAASAETIIDFSNQIAKASLNVEDLNQANLTLRNVLATNRLLAQSLSNQLAETTRTLATKTASFQDAQQQITNFHTRVAHLNTRVADLEAQNQLLDQRANSLSNSLASLDTQIAVTKMQLASSKTNNAFLEKQLQRQIAERAELERKFNDLAEVRAQVHKLRMDRLMALRLKWMHEGIDPTKPMKGAQLLMMHPVPPSRTAAASSPAYSLNVEVGSDGSVRVIPPPTNAPAK